MLSALLVTTTLAATPPLNTTLEARFAAWEAAGPTGDSTHREQLASLVKALKGELTRRGRLDILFVCTHNSRRSHMAQLLGAAAAARFGIPAKTFSGGTEATAFNPRAVAALKRVGFDITGSGTDNPRYEVRYGENLPTSTAFSKKLDAPENPKADFVAVMTCTQADKACPIVKGATKRVSVPYEDPKVADGTPDETARYDERAEQIGRDLAWVMAELAKT
jgi:arsenate reductase